MGTSVVLAQGMCDGNEFMVPICVELAERLGTFKQTRTCTVAICVELAERPPLKASKAISPPFQHPINKGFTSIQHEGTLWAICGALLQTFTLQSSHPWALPPRAFSRFWQSEAHGYPNSKYCPHPQHAQAPRPGGLANPQHSPPHDRVQRAPHFWI